MLLNSNGTFFDLLVAGGWAMIPLGLCSIATVAIVIERLLWGPRRSLTIPAQLVSQMEELATTGRLQELAGLCRADRSPLAALALTVIRNIDKPREHLIELVQSAGRREALKMQRYLATLGTIAAISPLLGLLGTVSGMIKTFTVLQEVGTGQAQALSGGISEALITTAAGLAIAIPALFFNRFFLQRVRVLVSDLEEIVIEFIHKLPPTTQLPGSLPTSGQQQAPGGQHKDNPVQIQNFDPQLRGRR